MQEITLILSSLVGVATAAVAVQRIPRNKSQLLSIGASSHIKSQANTLKIEKDILTKTISRLYQTESEFSKIQKDKLLLKYQHQLGIVLAKLEKLEQASKHPDLGPVGDGLITLMDQKLSKLDDRLYELSSKMTVAKTQVQESKEQTAKQEPKKRAKIFDVPDVQKPKDVKLEPIQIPATKSRQSFELTTLTNVPAQDKKFPLFEKDEIVKPDTIQTELIKPKEEIVKETIQPAQKINDGVGITEPVTPNLDTRLDIEKEVAKITEHKALAGPQEKPRSSTLDDDDGDADDLDKIKGNIMKVLSKLEQAEVE